MAEQLPQFLILRRRQVEQRTGLSRTSLYERIAAGTFPRPVSLGGGQAVGWYAHEVEAWLANLPRARAGATE